MLTVGGTNPDLVRRPPTANEDTVNPPLFGERYFVKASLRILLSDTQADLTNARLTGLDAAVLHNNGFTVYFSDRRNNRDAASQETGEFGWEDIIKSPTR